MIKKKQSPNFILGILKTNGEGVSIFQKSLNYKYQPIGAGGPRSPPAMPHRLQNPKWPPVGPKMAKGVWKGVQS